MYVRKSVSRQSVRMQQLIISYICKHLQSRLCSALYARIQSGLYHIDKQVTCFVYLIYCKFLNYSITFNFSLKIRRSLAFYGGLHICDLITPKIIITFRNKT